MWVSVTCGWFGEMQAGAAPCTARPKPPPAESHSLRAANRSWDAESAPCLEGTLRQNEELTALGITFVSSQSAPGTECVL